MDFAAGERLITNETAAFERPKCSARDFRLTLWPEDFRVMGVATDLGRGMGVIWGVVSHTRLMVGHGNIDFNTAVVQLHRSRTRLRAAG